jgi:biopolymer transport protein ExbB
MGTFSLLDLFRDGGPFMYPLAACSVIALTVIFAKTYALWAVGRSSRSVLARTHTLLADRRTGDALTLCAETPGPVAAVLHAGLLRVHAGELASGDVEQAIQSTGTIELGFLERGLSVLATISNVAPLLGFLGTVAGMIEAFGSIAAAGQVDAGLVAGGIKVALLTTAAGLMIAVPVNVAYNFLVTRIDAVIREMERGAIQVLGLAWSLSDDVVVDGSLPPC